MSNLSKPTTQTVAITHRLSRQAMTQLKSLPQFAFMQKMRPADAHEAVWRTGVQAVFDALEAGFVIDVSP